jgi:hypothetical protein
MYNFYIYIIMNIPTKIFIVPYRNRENHKNHFEIYMKYLLEDIPCTDYEIYFIHQNDKRPFNRGAIKNIGFLAMKAKYPNDYKNISFIFNDIDTMPAKKNVLNYNTEHGTIKHYYGFTFALGGIFSIKGGDFEKIGGFPNYWGWGLEDNCIQIRVLNAGLKIDRDNFFKIADHNILQLCDGLSRLITKQDGWRMNKTDDTYHDIKNLEYTIENDIVQVKNFTTKYDPKHETFYAKPPGNKIPIDPRFNPQSGHLMRMNFGARK